MKGWEPQNRLLFIRNGHELRSIYTPVSERIVCSCGWRHTETRRQNALARASKVGAAIRKHFRTVEGTET